MSLVETLRGRVEELTQRQKDLETLVSNPDEAGKATYPGYLRELGSLQKVLEPWLRYVDIDSEITEARELIRGDDSEMAELAAEELPALESEMVNLEKVILDRVLEDDPDADKPAIVEVRAGAGGDEAALFVGDLYRMYTRFAAAHGWKSEEEDVSDSEAGGYKEIVFKVKGEDAMRLMKWESGGHRVQRVPATETQGRIHTSAATVAVMPEVEDIDIKLKDEDLEIKAIRSGGPGGQSVNKTSSCIQVFHKPSGLQVKCQVEKSQLRNKERALGLLRARLYQIERDKRDAELYANRKSQVGSGDRSQRIRTYNFPQNRVSDHRINQNYSLEKIIEGRLEAIFEDLQAAEREAKLANL